MKKILITLIMTLMIGLSNVFALDFDKVEEVWDKSMDIATTQLDNLDFDKAEDVEAKVNNEMYVTELESKVVQLEAKVRLLEKEKDNLKKRNKELELYILELEYIKRQYDDLRYKSLYE